MIGTPVPETSVNEDRDFCADETDIGTRSGNPTVQPVSQTRTPKSPPKLYFRFGVVLSNGLHDPSTLFGRERVQFASRVTSQH